MPMPIAPKLPNRSSRFVSTEEVIVSERLAELRGRVRFLTWVSGLCWTALTLFGGLLISGTLDWLIHFDESGTRLVVGLAILAGSSWMLWRQLISPLRQQLSASFLASRIERRFPGIENRLLSAVEFLEHRLDAKLGSTELQKAVVEQALKDIEGIETSDVVEAKAVRNVTIAGAFVSAVALLVVLFHPVEAATSVQRLMFPFAKVPWPRTFELQLLRADLSPFDQASNQPLMIARGDMLDLYVQNRRGRLPERVWFEYRLGEDGPLIRETLRQTSIRDDKGQSRDSAVIHWVATRGTMSFRAVGGDDNVMPFYRVEVVPPPMISSLQVTIEPPAYSRRPKETLSPGVGHVEGLLGTKVEIIASSDKKLKSAQLHIGDQAASPLELDATGQNFTAKFEITSPTASTYWFELIDVLGFTDREAAHYELKGIADGVPDVNIEIPYADVQLTADAELPVKVLAKDDLGLHEVRITYQVGDDEKIVAIPLFQHAASTEGDGSTGTLSDITGEQALGPQMHVADYLWKMADLRTEPGTRIVFRAEATDDYDIGPPHVGKSVPRTITIVSSEEKQKELASRVGNLLDDLKQATQLQQRAEQQTEELRTQLEKVGEFRQQDLDQLRRTELDQRKSASRLTNPADGIESQSKQLLDEFRNNHVSDTGTQERLERIASELERLEREQLPETERALTQAQKLAEDNTNSADEPGGTSAKANTSTQPRDQASESNKKNSSEKPDSNASTSDREQKTEGKEAPRSASQQNDTETGSRNGPEETQKDESHRQIVDATEKALAEAHSRQIQTLETLKELQESLAEWRDRRDISHDLTSVIAEQESVQKDSMEMAQRVMTKSSGELTKQDKAELNKLAARQRKVADELEQFRKQLNQAAESLEKNDPDAADQLKEAAQDLKQHDTNSTLQDAAQNIADSKIGAAVEAQQKAMNELREVERMVKQLPQEDTEQFLKQTEEVRQDFEQIRQEQQDLADRAEQLSKQPDTPEKQDLMKQLKEQQEELNERMAKAERKLERLRLRGPADAAHRARKRLTEMMKDMQEADDADEMQQAMDEALDDLEQVERELALEKRIAQERLAFEQLEKIEDTLKGLRSRQEAVLAEITRLEELKAEAETLTRGQLKTLKEVADTERSLQHSVEQLQQQMTSAEVFALVLKRLARSMKLVADALGERETGQPTQTLAKDAIRKIDSLLEVLKQEKKKPEKPQEPTETPEELREEPQEQEEKPEEAQPPGDTIPQLAQLKLLKAMQEEFLERTETLEKFRDKDGKLPAAMEAEKIELAREQSELADYARNLIAKFVRPSDDSRQTEPKQSEPKKPEPENEKKKEIDPNQLDL